MKISYKTIFLSLIMSCVGYSVSFADQIKITLYKVNSNHQSIGYVIAKDTKLGLLLEPHLKDLPQGIHGFHIHRYASCADHAKAAGGHLDPYKTGKHLGPYRFNGHLGDLPALMVDKDGVASLPLLAPRLRVSQIRGHAMMIHAGGDNYSDYPKKLGGGGARIACGVIPK